MALTGVAGVSLTYVKSDSGTVRSSDKQIP